VKKINRPRGTCWGCYYQPGVKELYPSTSKYASRGVGNTTKQSALPAEPTKAEPGSEEKIRVMCARVRRGESVSHPDDVMIGAASEPWTVPTAHAYSREPHLSTKHTACGRRPVEDMN
jgi:hypothetical protein